ncbi:MAG: PTS sugar transporter subunit IIA [Proteobacteria bacterium]|nr:PTS sugar transporter subunit IIA [Pseudomonadota bacterium]
MNLIAPYLAPKRIRLDLDAGTKSRVFEEAGQLFAADIGLDATRVAENLGARERLGSTGLGHGVAFPHARVPGLSHALAAFIRLRPPITFDAPDGKPVSELLILLVPEKATEAHLQLLAEAAQMFADPRFREHLRNQDDAFDVYRAFADWPAITA